MKTDILALFLAGDDEAFLNSVHEQGLAELESDNVAVQIGRIFRTRRARLPSCWCWRRQVLLRRHHDDLGHRSDGYRGSRFENSRLPLPRHNNMPALDEILNHRN